MTALGQTLIFRQLRGTLESNARERIFTIDSICYNLMTGKLEYPIEEAKEDMDNGIIRMIDDPLKLFIANPLYLLECIHRAQKLDFKLDDEIKKMY
jgi:poly(A) polymerase